MRRRLRLKAGPDPGSRLRLSFIDITAGGFGAAAFLAVILFAMPLTSSSGRMGSQQFIHLIVSWDNSDVLMELIVHTPRGDEIRLAPDQSSSSDINPFTGEVATPSSQWQAALVSGDSHFGSNSVVDVDGTKRFISLRIVAPCPTEQGGRGWAFDLGVRKTLRQGMGLEDLTVEYEASLYTADSEARGGEWKAGSGAPLLGKTDLLGCASGSVCREGQTGVQLEWLDPRGQVHRELQITARDVDSLSHCRT